MESRYTHDWILRNPLKTFVYETIDQSKNKPTVQWPPEKVNRVCDGLIYLFKQGFETAFICRYKSHVHGGLSPEEIQRAMNGYMKGLELNRKVANSLSTDILKIAKLEDRQAMEKKLKNCKDMREYNEIREEYMPARKKTEVEIVRELGLDVYAEAILHYKVVDFSNLVCEEMKDEGIVEKYLKVCLADQMNRDENVRILAVLFLKQETLSEKMKVTTAPTKWVERSFERAVQREHSNSYFEKDDEFERFIELWKKYGDYLNKKWDFLTIRDHQVSVLNRAAGKRFLTWKVDLPKKEAILLHPYAKKTVHPQMQKFYNEAFEYSIDNFFIPKVTRMAKNTLTERSEETSIYLFGRNIEQLFAQEGINSRFVIALDPGSMIKAAFLKPNGKVIATSHFGIDGQKFSRKGQEMLEKWADHCRNNNTKLVFAVGNGHNSHNTLAAVVDMIQQRKFPDQVDAGYCVVPEHGASKYSCTPVAEEEFGKSIDITEISAISIGRRLIDPMSEYVKIEPQHLGKGQYQHSVNKDELNAKLLQVVRDRVSLIGTDLNTASKHLLEKVCGLNGETAAAIVKYREENERFNSREELKQVDGITDDIFRMCSGFLRVYDPEPPSSRPHSNRQKTPKPSWNPLDMTSVHPDDYISTLRLLNRKGLTVEEATDGRDLQGQGTSEGDARIIELLTKKSELRPPPPIKKSVPKNFYLEEGDTVTGTVSNQTEFGVFVDFGYENDGLCHINDIDPHLRSKEKPRGKKHPSKTEDPSKKTDVTKSLPSVNEVLEFVVIGKENERIKLKLKKDQTDTENENPRKSQGQ